MHGYLEQFLYPDNMATASLMHTASLPDFAIPGGIPILSRNLSALEVGAFGDVGWVWSNSQQLRDGELLADLGVTVSYQIPYRLVTRLLGNRPIRAYFPFWVSDPLPGDDAMEFRWQVAFSRSW
jgi:hypothetical protein